MDDNNIKNIAHQIFNIPPEEPNSYGLQFENQFSKDDDVDEAVFKVLTTILIEGLKIHYADQNGVVDLTKLTNQNFELMGQYIRSLGYETIFYVYKKDEEPKNMNHANNVFRVNPKGTDIMFTVSFKVYRPDGKCK